MKTIARAGAALVIVAAFVAACTQASQPAAQPAPASTYVHIDELTGCHYIIFPEGPVVRVKADGLPYCDAPTAPAAPAQ